MDVKLKKNIFLGEFPAGLGWVDWSQTRAWVSLDRLKYHSRKLINTKEFLIYFIYLFGSGHWV